MVFGKDKKHHDSILDQVFDRLAANDMALSIDKCTFGKSSVEYLGYTVTATGIKPLARKLKALEEFKDPQTQKDVLHFCGALN